MINNMDNNMENNMENKKSSIIKKKKVFDIFECYHVDADELGFLTGVEYPGFLFERTINSIKDTVTFSFENSLIEETACPNILAVADLFGIDYIVDKAEEFKKNGKDIEIYEGIMDSIRKPQKIDFSNIENFEDEDFESKDFEDEDFESEDFEDDDVPFDDSCDEKLEELKRTFREMMELDNASKNADNGGNKSNES